MTLGVIPGLRRRRVFLARTDPRHTPGILRRKIAYQRPKPSPRRSGLRFHPVDPCCLLPVSVPFFVVFRVISWLMFPPYLPSERRVSCPLFVLPMDYVIESA